MRRALLLLLALALVPRPAHADPMDQITFVGDGDTIQFLVPASTTGPDDLINSDFNPVVSDATVNGVPGDVGVGIVYNIICGICPGILLNANSQIYTLYLPDLYQLTYPSSTTETFTFVPGTYDTAEEAINVYGDVPFTITIAPEAATATPEPPSLWLLATGVLGLLFFWRRHRFGAAHPFTCVRWNLRWKSPGPSPSPGDLTRGSAP